MLWYKRVFTAVSVRDNIKCVHVYLCVCVCVCVCGGGGGGGGG